LFAEEAINQQQQVIDNELHGKREEDGYRVRESVTRALWRDITPSIDDRIAKLPSITRQDILDYYAQFYHLQNLHFVVCGDISDAAIKKMKATFQSALKNAPQGQHSAYQPKSDRIAKKNILITQATAQDVSSFELRFYVPYLDDETLAARRVLRAYLAGGLGSVMQRELREAGLTYTISSYFMNQDEHSGFGFADRVPHKNLVPLLQKCFAYIQAVADGEIDEVAFSRSKGLIKNSQEAALQRSSDFLNWYFDELRHRRELQSPLDFYAELDAVSQENLQKVAQQYLSGEGSHWLLSVATKSEEITEKMLASELASSTEFAKNVT
jgi:predicted Zn-dependent peptidase